MAGPAEGEGQELELGCCCPGWRWRSLLAAGETNEGDGWAIRWEAPNPNSYPGCPGPSPLWMNSIRTRVTAQSPPNTGNVNTPHARESFTPRLQPPKHLPWPAWLPSSTFLGLSQRSHASLRASESPSRPHGPRLLDLTQPPHTRTCSKGLSSGLRDSEAQEPQV